MITSSLTSLRAAMAAIGLYLAAILGFDLMAVFVRVLSERYTVVELSVYRNVIGVLPSIVLLLWTRELTFKGGALKIGKWRLALWRGVVVGLAQLLFYGAVATTELVTVATLAQTNALFVVLLSVLLLKERVGPWRIGAVLIGFVGVVWVLRPGAESFSLSALLPIAAAFCYAYVMVTVRLFGPEVSNALLYLYSSFASATSFLLLVLVTSSFTPIASWEDAALIFGMSMSGGIAVLLLMMSFRLASPSSLAPFGYIGILTAGLWGYFLFGEAPLETVFPGALLIIAAGVLILWRESRSGAT